VAAADGSFLRRVKLGARAGDRMEVVDGLRAGEQVVGAGSLFMQFAESQ
jgi:cobalt-zinc-cadmium efflux system membrane fusion protein